MIKRLHHIAIAVQDTEAVLKFYRDVLGLQASRTVIREDRGLKITFIPVGETQLELLEPITTDNTVARFLEKRGEGMHHLSFEVDQIDEAMRQVAERGAELIDAEARPGATGMVAFIHPSSAHGVLVELNQETAESDS